MSSDPGNAYFVAGFPVKIMAMVGVSMAFMRVRIVVSKDIVRTPN
jgi:hypothetical protein